MAEVDLTPNGSEALTHVRVEWDETRTERALRQTHLTLQRQHSRRRVAAVMGALIGLIAVVLFGLRGLGEQPSVRTPSSTSAAAATQTEKRVRFKDGSIIELLGAQSEVEVISVSDARIEVELVRGQGRFQIVPNPGRAFEVRAGVVTVSVIGTEFVLELRGHQVWVQVMAGRVRVAWAGGDVRLEAGGEGLFPLEGTAAGPASAATNGGSVPPGGDVTPPGRSPADRYRTHAKLREYQQAYRMLKTTPSVVGSNAEDLMLAADVARLSGHPGEAAKYLRRVVAEHSGAGQAPLAAFTLGRVYLGIGRLNDAMRAFRKVTFLAPGSPLAEDALARQVELAAQSGDPATARRLAKQYLAAYPRGRRRDAVRRQGGLD